MPPPRSADQPGAAPSSPGDPPAGVAGATGAAARVIRWPPADLADRPLPVRVLEPDAGWWRVHPCAYDPVHFGRAAGHRFSPPDAPFPVLYAAETIATCLLEIFGDELLDQGANRLSLSRWEARCVTRVRVVGPRRACDLTTPEGLLAVGGDLASLLDPTLRAPQAWAGALMRHPAAVDGLLYLSRFGGGTALALFGRPDAAVALAVDPPATLVDSPEGADFLRRFRVALI